MLYDIAFLIFSLIYLPTLLFKGKLHRDFLERFGIYDKRKKEILSSDDKDKIWIQAVSVGEVALCRNFVGLLKEKFPDSQIVLSTITKTGGDLAKRIFSEDATVIYFPLDFSSIIKRVVSLIRPKLYIMVETEIWPNIIKELSRNRVPSVLINGRISDRSFAKYILARRFLKDILAGVNLFCMQSKTGAERIISLGAPPDKVKVTGNMKFDVEMAKDVQSQGRIQGLSGLKDDEELFVGGSTHEGEERILIEVYKELVEEFPKIRLLIAPRHIDRVSEIERLVRHLGFEPVRTSTLKPSTINHQLSTIFILDTIGQLKDVYAIATVVFIGGSLVKHGGQNPIEPAILERPILFGPHMFNFKDVASIFLKSDAAIQVMDKKDLLEKAIALLRNSEARIRLGQNAKRAVFENRGSTERNLHETIHLFVDD